MYNFLKSGNPFPISIKDIEEIEKNFNIKFPIQLRNFYLSYNAIDIDVCIIKVNENKYEVAKIIPLKTGKNSFEDLKTDELIDKIIPESFMPFARDRGGAYYYWDNNNSGIYIIYPDFIEQPILICYTISEFFSLLQISDN